MEGEETQFRNRGRFSKPKRAQRREKQRSAMKRFWQEIKEDNDSSLSWPSSQSPEQHGPNRPEPPTHSAEPHASNQPEPPTHSAEPHGSNQSETPTHSAEPHGSNRLEPSAHSAVPHWSNQPEQTTESAEPRGSNRSEPTTESAEPCGSVLPEQSPASKDSGPNTVQLDHNYAHPSFLDDVQHFEVINGTHEDDNISITDLNHHRRKRDIPRSAVPLDTMKHILDLKLLVESLKKGCKKCSVTLDMTQALGVLPRGLGGFLYIRCKECKEISIIQLSKTHENKQSPSKHHSGIFDINTKAACGMIHAGLGERSLNNFLSVLNLNTLSKPTLKNRENEIGVVMEKQASESEQKWALEELKKTILETPVQRSPRIRETTKRSHSLEPNKCAAQRKPRARSTSPGYSSIGMDGSIDTCYQKRGSQRSYNSLSGASTIISRRLKKVICRSMRCKGCKQCAADRGKDSKSRKPHNCKKNWDGSAKAMEPDMFCEMISEMKKKGLGLHAVSGDDDNTGFARAKINIDPNLKKLKDKNHVRKGITSKLFKLKNSKKYKELSVTVITALSKYFNYMLTQNQGNPAGIRRGLRAIVCHAYNNHAYCSSKWCNFLKKKNGKHSNLPRGKSLTCPSLKKALIKIFIKDLSPQADQLAQLGSSQPNESFNYNFSRKAQKAVHLSSSASLSYRFSATVLQQNEGYGYVPTANEELLLSPGYTTRKRACVLDRERDRNKAKRQTVEYKRRRLELKSARAGIERSNEILEGETYGTDIALSETPDLEKIPDIIDDEKHIPENSCEIIFDLETTSLSRACDLTQIAAKTHSGDTFSRFVLPMKPISAEATRKTKFTRCADKLYLNKQEVQAVSQKEALVSFVEFLEEHKPVVLVGQNIKAFDMKVLFNKLTSYGLWNRLCDITAGIVDIRLLAKEIVPAKACCNQEALVLRFLGTTYEAHNAINDVAALHKLWIKIKPEILRKHESNIMSDIRACEDLTHLEASYSELIQSKAMSQGMVSKAAKSGLCLGHLKKAIERDSIDGLTSLLTHKRTSGKPRVTGTKHIIQRIFDAIANKK